MNLLEFCKFLSSRFLWALLLSWLVKLLTKRVFLLCSRNECSQNEFSRCSRGECSRNEFLAAAHERSFHEIEFLFCSRNEYSQNQRPQSEFLVKMLTKKVLTKQVSNSWAIHELYFKIDEKVFGKFTWHKCKILRLGVHLNLYFIRILLWVQRLFYFVDVDLAGGLFLSLKLLKKIWDIVLRIGVYLYRRNRCTT